MSHKAEALVVALSVKIEATSTQQTKGPRKLLGLPRDFRGILDRLPMPRLPALDDKPAIACFLFPQVDLELTHIDRGLVPVGMHRTLFHFVQRCNWRWSRVVTFTDWAQVVSSISGVMDYDGLVRCEFRIPRLWNPEVFSVSDDMSLKIFFLAKGHAFSVEIKSISATSVGTKVSLGFAVHKSQCSDSWKSGSQESGAASCSSWCQETQNYLGLSENVGLIFPMK